MKKIFCLLCLTSFIFAQENKDIQLLNPDLNRGLPVLKALSQRASLTDYDTTSLTMRDLSDLLWAANGINRPETGKRTAPSAINAQDIDVYVFLKDAAYLYKPEKNLLQFVAAGDQRNVIAGSQVNVAKSPVILVLISDFAKFNRGDDQGKMLWAAEDAGIVSQNISVFCASVNLGSRPRAQMDIDKLKEILKLKDTQHPMLNNPVCYKK